MILNNESVTVKKADLHESSRQEYSAIGSFYLEDKKGRRAGGGFLLCGKLCFRVEQNATRFTYQWEQGTGGKKVMAKKKRKGSRVGGKGKRKGEISKGGEGVQYFAGSFNLFSIPEMEPKKAKFDLTEHFKKLFSWWKNINFVHAKTLLSAYFKQNNTILRSKEEHSTLGLRYTTPAGFGTTHYNAGESLLHFPRQLAASVSSIMFSVASVVSKVPSAICSHLVFFK